MYELGLSGRLPADWSDWFEGFEINVIETQEGPLTQLAGPVADQAALHGLLARVRDLALPILWVREISGSDGSTANTPPGT